MRQNNLTHAFDETYDEPADQRAWQAAESAEHGHHKGRERERQADLRCNVEERRHQHAGERDAGDTEPERNVVHAIDIDADRHRTKPFLGAGPQRLPDIGLAQEKINTPLREIDVKLIKALNLRESNNAEDALIIYKDIISSKLLDKFNSDDDQIRVYFDMGIAYSYNKDFDNAIIAFNKCIRLNPASETWLVPHSYFELGKIYDKKGDKNRSADMFEKIFDYNDFDFESFLEMRLANYGNK